MSEQTPTEAAIAAENGKSKSSSYGFNDTSPTHILCDWISYISLSDIPNDLLTRAKYVLLDGIACALTGAALSASEVATRAISLMEAGGTGTCSVIGHPDMKLSPTSAALINSTYIQGFELDDWHKDAPLHSNAILIPALLAAAQLKTASSVSAQRVTGPDFLLGLITGYEVGPRVGNALYGRHILSEGWHSGAVFGPSAAAAAVSKIFHLQPEAVEDALGIACNQACGLMSVQFESDVKRMAHG